MAVFSSLSLFFKLTGSVSFITLFLIDPRNAETVLPRKHSLETTKDRETLKMLDFLYLLRKASWNLLRLLLFSVQPQTVLMVKTKQDFCESRVDTAGSLNQTLLTGWWTWRPRPRTLL